MVGSQRRDWKQKCQYYLIVIYISKSQTPPSPIIVLGDYIDWDPTVYTAQFQGPRGDFWNE